MRKWENGSGMQQWLMRLLLTGGVLLGVFGMGSRIGEALAPPNLAAAGRVVDMRELPVIMYHSLLRDPAQWGPYVLSPEAFERDLEYLQEKGYETVTVSDLVRYVKEQDALPEKPVMLTFDDGFYNNLLYAAPLLQERGMRAVISVIGEETEKFTDNGQTNPYWAYLSADGLRKITAEGIFEVQNHSYALHTIGNGKRGCLQKQGETETAYRQRFTADTHRAQQLIMAAGLPAPQCYTYPFGAYDDKTEEILQQEGFQCTMICEERRNIITREPESLFGLGRYNRPSGESTERFMARALGEE